MGPVSFDRLEAGDSLDEARSRAKALAAAGIRVQIVDDSRTLLVRSEDGKRARSVLEKLSNGDSSSSASSDPKLIEPLLKPPQSAIVVPGSKSHTNRALLCAALANGTSVLDNALFADDTAAMTGALETLGARFEGELAARRMTIDGSAIQSRTDGTSESSPIDLDLRQSGTTSRFLLPVLAGLPGSYAVDGDPQLRARPFQPQIEVLREFGATIDGLRLPLTIEGRRLAGASVDIETSLSSQFLSGLLMAAPLYMGETTIRRDGALVSRPYIELTIATMADFGVDVDVGSGFSHFRIPEQLYEPRSIVIEPDASAASYFFAAAAITGGTVKINGLGTSSIQGDVRFVDVLEQMGAAVTRTASSVEVTGPAVLRGVSVDMADISDTAQTLAVVATFADSPTTIDGIGFIRAKETDRIGAVVTELNRRSISATETDNGMTISPGRPTPGVVNTYDDHRMAMSFALLGLAHPGIEIENPGCVAKTFPDFFEVLENLRGR